MMKVPCICFPSSKKKKWNKIDVGGRSFDDDNTKPLHQRQDFDEEKDNGDGCSMTYGKQSLVFSNLSSIENDDLSSNLSSNNNDKIVVITSDVESTLELSSESEGTLSFPLQQQRADDEIAKARYKVSVADGRVQRVRKEVCLIRAKMDKLVDAMCSFEVKHLAPSSRSELRIQLESSKTVLDSAIQLLQLETKFLDSCQKNLQRCIRRAQRQEQQQQQEQVSDLWLSSMIMNEDNNNKTFHNSTSKSSTLSFDALPLLPPPMEVVSPRHSPSTPSTTTLSTVSRPHSPLPVHPWTRQMKKRKKQQTLQDESTLRKRAIEHYNGGTVMLFCHDVVATCVVTGVKGMGHQVIASYLLPVREHEYWKEKFHTDMGMNDVRNLLLIAANIKAAFDRLQLCLLLVPHPEERQNQKHDNDREFYIRVWDPSILDQCIFEGSNSTIRDFEGKHFSFPPGKLPFVKVFSSHAQVSYIEALKQGWIQPNHNDDKDYFESPFYTISTSTLGVSHSTSSEMSTDDERNDFSSLPEMHQHDPRVLDTVASI